MATAPAASSTGATASASNASCAFLGPGLGLHGRNRRRLASCREELAETLSDTALLVASQRQKRYLYPAMSYQQVPRHEFHNFVDLSPCSRSASLQIRASSNVKERGIAKANLGVPSGQLLGASLKLVVILTHCK
ncbi:unnamed protein product [Polarella glacialis]|uniref:Uncharacterized protein n=1 Tax=Polarella glacialis TaxID=89957 RepID=A0A813ENK5_POLGL|nr:unnamed protein product [Polarella glacialis]